MRKIESPSDKLIQNKLKKPSQTTKQEVIKLLSDSDDIYNTSNIMIGKRSYPNKYRVYKNSDNNTISSLSDETNKVSSDTDNYDCVYLSSPSETIPNISLDSESSIEIIYTTKKFRRI